MQTIQTDQPETQVTASREQTIQLSEETIARLDALREDGQSYDELVTELADIYHSLEWSMAHSGDVA